MKILADANPVFSGQLTGIGYYTDELLAHLSKISVLEGFAFNYKSAKSVATRYPVQQQVKLPGKLLSYPRYAKVDVPLSLFFKLDNADIVLGTNYLLPPTGKTPNVVTIHDMCFIDHPEWVQGRNAHILRNMLPKTLDRSKALITISEFSAGRIRNIYGYKKPILVISIPPKRSIAGTLKPKLSRRLVKRKFFLFIGTIEPRKNINTLLDAFEELPKSVQDEYPLVLGGKPGWDPVVLARLRSGNNQSIVYLDYVTEAERNWLYKNATATIIPSHYEGFGMMTLESLSAGTPTIVSDIAPQREILGASGNYFMPSDRVALSELMVKYTQPTYRADALLRQLPVLSRHAWQDTAIKVNNFLKEAMDI